MPRKRFTVGLLVLFLYAFGTSALMAEDAGLQSTMEMDFSAIAAIDGIRVVAARGVPGKSYTEDYGPSQVLEIIRTDQAAISVGRLMTSCACLRATMEKRDFAQGERALIEVRNVKPTMANGATYAIFVRLNNPYKATLQYELFAKSDRQPTGQPVAAAPIAAAPVVAPLAVPAPEPAKAPDYAFEDIVPYRQKSPEPNKQANVAPAQPAGQ